MNTLGMLLQHYLRLIYRDRNTKIYGVLLPLMLYPLVLFLAGQGRLVLAGLNQARHNRLVIDLPGERKLAGRIATLARKEGLEARVVTRQERPVEPPAAGLLLTREREQGRLHLAAPAQGGLAPRAGLRRAIVALRHQELAPAPPVPLPRVTLAVTSRQATPASHLLSRILPLILIVMSALGALFPAVEVTAGELERGTAETTMLLPVTGRQLAQARLTAVILATMGAVYLNLGGMILSAGTFFADPQAPLGLTAGGLAATGLLGLVLVLFFASLMLLLCGAARGFKEAQAYATPATTLAFLPGAAAFFQELPYDLTTACIPLVNVSLGLREALSGRTPLRPLALTICLMLALSLLLFHLANRPLGQRRLHRYRRRAGDDQSEGGTTPS